MNEELARVNIFVMGEVQGVFFRASTLEQAQSLSLTGWVKNLADGSVEVMAEGNKSNLEQLVRWCRQGPSTSKVKDVRERWSSYEEEFRTFMIVR